MHSDRDLRQMCTMEGDEAFSDRGLGTYTSASRNAEDSVPRRWRTCVMGGGEGSGYPRLNQKENLVGLAGDVYFWAPGKAYNQGSGYLKML